MPEKKILKTVQADETLKRKIDQYHRLNQQLKGLKDELEPIKAGFLELGECEIYFGDRKLATQKVEPRKSFVMPATEPMVFRTH
jgi:hypothetical protein